MKMIFRYCVPLFISLLLMSCNTTSTVPPGQKSPEPKTGTKTRPLEIKGKITIRWKSQSQETYGFNIYRGESHEGPFMKINKEIITAAGSAATQKEFVFIDQPLEIGKIFYYYVESVSFAGQKETITPITKVVVKTPVTESQE